MKNTPYQGFIKHYPAQVNFLRGIAAKDQDIFTQVRAFRARAPLYY